MGYVAFRVTEVLKKHFLTVSFYPLAIKPDIPQKSAAVLVASRTSYCIVYSAGRPVSRSIRFAMGGWVENRLPRLIPRNG